MKSYLRVIILLVGISFLTLNCKKDEYKEINSLVLSDADIPPTHGHQYTIQELLNNDETFIQLSNQFLKEDILNRNSLLKRSNGDSLTITSDTVNVVEKANYKSYTLRVKRKGKNFDTENLVIENKKGKENAFIIGYKFDNDWIEQKANGIKTAPKGRVFFEKYDYSFLKSEVCYTMDFTLTIPCGCGHTNPYVCNGCPTAPTWPAAWYYEGTYCTSDSGNDNETGTPFTTESSENEGTPGGGSPSPPSDTDDTSQTEMNLEDITEFVELKLNRLVSKLSLNKSEADWASDNIAQALAIHDFCSFSGWNSLNIDIARDAINTLSITNISYDKEIDDREAEKYKLSDLEPVKAFAGKISDFKNLLDNSPRKVGKFKGLEASNYLRSLGNTKFNFKQMRPLPTQTGFFNNKVGRYIYTRKGGWIDMSHFMFYAGKAYDYKLDGEQNPIGEAVQDGYAQERSDGIVASHSAYSYEDLPSDRFGAEFAVNHFDQNSSLTFGEQLLNYFVNVLEAANPSEAPNFNEIPDQDSRNKPSRTNNTTIPVFTTANP